SGGARAAVLTQITSHYYVRAVIRWYTNTCGHLSSIPIADYIGNQQPGYILPRPHYETPIGADYGLVPRSVRRCSHRIDGSSACTASALVRGDLTEHHSGVCSNHRNPQSVYRGTVKWVISASRPSRLAQSPGMLNTIMPRVG